MLTQTINGVRIEYKPVRFVDEFNGEYTGRTLKELLGVLTSKDAEKRGDYKNLLQKFLDVRLLVLKHIWPILCGETALVCLADKTILNWNLEIKKLAEPLRLSEQETVKIINFANPYVEEPKVAAV